MIFLNLFKDSLRVTREEESGIDTKYRYGNDKNIFESSNIQ